MSHYYLSVSFGWCMIAFLTQLRYVVKILASSMPNPTICDSKELYCQSCNHKALNNSYFLFHLLCLPGLTCLLSLHNRIWWLQERNCTLREAVIIGSIIQKVTIPPLHARLAEYSIRFMSKMVVELMSYLYLTFWCSAALMKLAEMEYCGTTR